MKIGSKEAGQSASQDVSLVHMNIIKALSYNISWYV